MEGRGGWEYAGDQRRLETLSAMPRGLVFTWLVDGEVACNAWLP